MATGLLIRAKEPSPTSHLRTVVHVTDIENPSLPSTWIKQARKFRASGDEVNAKLASLRGAQRARSDPKIPKPWAGALASLDQAELDELTGNDAMSQQYLQDALTAALDGLDAAAQQYGGSQ
jgi:hypothetical protein